MTNQERLRRAERIRQRQIDGAISADAAARELDDLMMEEHPAVLVFCGDSTGLTAAWDSDVMLFPLDAAAASPCASNTGIYVRGVRRGKLVTFPAGNKCNADAKVLNHFKAFARRGWIGGEV